MKGLNKKLENIIRVFLIVATILANFSFIPKVFAADNTPQNGDIRNNPLSNGTGEDGDIKFTKTISPTNEKGVFDVTLRAEGEDVETTTATEAAIYVAVVLDTSGSMPDSNSFGPKYTNAKSAIESFSRELLKSDKYPNAKIGLYTFNDSASELRGFSNTPLITSQIDYPEIKGYWQTHMDAGITLATQKLHQASAQEENAKLYMIVVSDGRPEFSGATSGQAFQLARDAATEAKKDIEIFTVGYSLKDTEAINFLKNDIATDASHAIQAEITNTSEGAADGIVARLTNLVNSITVSVNVGTPDYIEDVIASNFEYVEGSANPSDVTLSNNKKKIRFNNLGDITEEGIEVSFKIRIKEDTINKPGWYKTNDHATIKYDDATGTNNNKTIGQSAEVYWGLQYYTYTVKFLEQGTNTPLADPINGPETLLGEQVTENAATVKGYNPDATSKSITISKGTNEIIFYYTKKNNLTYVTEYYVEVKDGEGTSNQKISNDSERGNTVGGMTYGEEVLLSIINGNKYLEDAGFGYKSGVIIQPADTDRITIDDGDNIIKVCY